MKITELELTTITGYRSVLSQTYSDLGRLAVESKKLQSSMEELFLQETMLQRSISEWSKRIEAKYGEGVVDLSNGSFTPNSTDSV